MYATIDDLRSQLGGTPAISEAYAAKMLHPFPTGAIVNREAFILERAAGKRILEFGASGRLHARLGEVALVTGIDRQDAPHILGFDLDDVSLPIIPGPSAIDLLLACEVIEHLANPGYFLHRVKAQWPTVPMIVTVPNALSAINQKHLVRGLENVNIDHVAWYSPRTLRTLLEKTGWSVTAWCYYNGDGPSAEGLIAVVA